MASLSELAGAARFDLSADAQDRPHRERARDRRKWLDRAQELGLRESEQPRGYTVNFPVTHLGWRSLAVRFKPAETGTVTLTLMGPFEEASNEGRCLPARGFLGRCASRRGGSGGRWL